MLDWLTPTVTVDTAIPVDRVALRLVIAAVYGLCVAAIFRISHGRTKNDASVLVSTLVLLSILIAMVSMVIGDSVARAFSLVGALSIVRFRTVVEDTRDTAFVIFAVIVGMAAGAGLLLVPCVGIPVVAVAATLMNRRTSHSVVTSAVAGNLSVRLGLGRDPGDVFKQSFDKHLSKFQLMQVETTRQGAALELHYRVRLRSAEAMTQLVSELNRTDGVQNVDLRIE